MKRNLLTKWMAAIFCMLCFCLNASANESNRYETIDANEDVAEVQAAMMAAKAAESANSARRSVMLMSSGGIDTYTASGDLDEVVGSGNLNFTFKIDKPYTEITSAKLHINAYDVDYPSNNEHDKVYFNGEYVGRFKGANGEYRVNTFTIKPSLIKCPSSEGATAVNRFSVAVNVDNGGWVTGVGWAKLEIEGETFTLTASKDDSRGIMLKWTDVGNYYNVWRKLTVNGQWHQICTDLTSTSYLDRDTLFSRDYHYYVVANSASSASRTRSVQMKSNGASSEGRTDVRQGMRKGDPIAPKIVKVEFPRSGGWIRNYGPKCMKITWNEWDKEIYQIDWVKFTIQQKEGNKKRCDYTLRYNEKEPNRLTDTEFLNMINGKGFNLFSWNIEFNGDCAINIIVSYQKREAFWIDGESQYNDSVKIFFHKYGDSSSTKPNWYKYWIEDGALADNWKKKLEEEYKYEQYRRKNGNIEKTTYGLASIGYATVDVVFPMVPPVIFPSIKRWTPPSVEKYVYSPAVAIISEVKLRNSFKVGGNLRGIEALAAAIMHEDEHVITAKGKYLKDDGSPRIYVAPGNYFYANDLSRGIDSLEGFLKSYPNYDKKDSLNKYIASAKMALAEKSEWAVDHDNDNVLDETENNETIKGGRKTRTTSSDTFGIADVSEAFSEYRNIGDNEIRSRIAEEKPITGITKSNDWGVPGYNFKIKELRIPFGEGYYINSETLEGYNEDSWSQEKKFYDGNGNVVVKWLKPRDYILNEYFYRFDSDGALLTPSVERVANRMSLMAANNDIVDTNNSEYCTGVLQQLFSYSINPLDTTVLLNKESMSLNYREYGAGNCLLYKLNIENMGTNSFGTTVRAYLADTNNQVCVKSEKYIQLKPGTNNVDLVFSGEHIYRQRSSGYLVGLVEVVTETSHVNKYHAVATNVVSTQTNISYSAFTPYRAVIVSKNPDLCCSGSNLVFDCEIELNKQGSYCLRGALTDTNGVNVAYAHCTNLTGIGTHTVPLSFSKEDIYLSGIPGSYQLSLLELRDSEWDLVDWIEKPISAGDLTNARPANAVLSAIPESFSVAANSVSSDGLCDAIRGSFAVSNALDEVVECQLSITVGSTNEPYVCRVYKTVRIGPGETPCAFEIPGVEIVKSGVDGPYFISDILLEPVDESISAERLVPPLMLIEMELADFGGTPFVVAGAATCREIDKYTPIAVDVPVHVLRPGEIIASVIVTDAGGEFVLRAETNTVVSVGSNQTVSVSVSTAELLATGNSGPYVVSYLLLQSGYEGVEEIRIDEFEETREVDFSIYVDAVNGNDSNDGLTPETPKKSLVAAVSFALEGTTVYVGAGDYTCPSEIGEGETYLTISKKVNLVAQNKDPAKTRIIGPGGVSTNDIRGVWLAEGAMISGFTITNFTMSAGGGVGIYGEGLGAVVSNCVIAGCSATHDGGGVYQCSVYDSTIRGCRAQNGGGAAQCKLIRCTIEDNFATQYGGGVAYGAATNCIIRKCTATNGGGGVAYANIVASRVEQNKTSRYGGGGYSGSLERCFVSGNVAYYYGGGLASGTAYDCVIKGNSSSREGGGTDSATLYNCTVVGNSATQHGGGVYSGRIVNSIVWGNTAAISSNHYRAQGVHNCTTPLMSGNGNIDADPQMRGAGFGGFMLSSASPCLNAGLNNGETAFVESATGVTNATKAIVLDQDFFGNVRTQDGRVDMGAVEGVTNACLVMTKAVGHGSLDVSFELLTPHSSLTITADESIRPIDRIEISNGRIVRDSKVTLEDITTDVFITAYFKYYDFYVDAENGDDANDGFSAATAKRTIQAAVDCAMDGEKIFVSKGRYAPISTNDKKIEVVATDGVSLTFIDGGKTNRCATLANESSSVSTQTNTVLVGFTLTNGHATSGGGSYGGTLKECVYDDNIATGADYCYGGGSYYGVQYNCQYRNNATEGDLYGRGGAAYYGMSYNCSYVNNSAAGGTEGNGGAVYYGTHYDCALTNNTASTYGGGGYGGSWYRVTIHKNKAATGGGLYEGSVYVGTITGNKAINGEGGGTYKTYLNDCYIANNQASGNGGGALLTDDYAYRCAFVNNRSLASGGGVYGGICYDCGITNNVAVSNGGGAYNVTATRTAIVGNSAVSGGGVYNGTYNFCTVSGNTASSDGGGAYNGTFNDSEISGNTASGVGGGSYYATVHRTKILFNTAISDGGGMYRGSGYNSLIAKNKTVAPGGGTYNATLYNCTVTENWSGNTGGGTYNGSLYNTIIYGNTNPDGANNAVGSSQTSCKTSDPIFVNAKEGDYRLRVGSSCINSGNASYVNGSTDLALANRVQDGRVDIGAYEGGVEGRVVSVESLGVGKLEYGAYIVTNGGSFVISAQDTGRRFLHFKTNGVIATTSPILILDGVSDDVTVTAEFVHEMFVDGASGSDDSDGLSWESAKKTIQAAIDASVDGDTIWVAGGIYTPIVVKGRKIEIISTDGPERTIIDGGGTSCCAWLGDEKFYQFANDARLSGFTLRYGYINGNGGGVKYGRIDNCVVENCRATGNGGGIDCSSASNCIVRYNSADGTGGGSYVRVWHRFTDCQFIGNTARSNGGGAYLNGNAILRNCRFSGNVSGSGGGALYNGVAYDSVMSSNKAASGGGTYNGTFYRCKLNGNTSSGDGGGAYSGTFYDCIVSNNIASGAGGGLIYSTFHRTRVSDNFAAGNGGGVYSGTGYNSIIARNRTDSSGGGSYSGYNYNCTIVENYAAAGSGGTYSGTQYNSIVWNNNSHYGVSNLKSGSQYNCCTVDPLFVNAAEGDYRVRNTSACINAGNASYVNGSYDVAQRTRVQDGTVDIGAHEGGVGGFVVNLDFKGGASAEHSSVIVSSNGTFTVYSISSERPFVGCFTNGVFVSASLPFTLSGIVSDVDLSIECAHTLYVDADSDVDDKDGFDWANAKRSIQAAIDVSLSGDVIYVADGWYEPFVSENRKIRIVSENGPENCIVDGSFESRCATLGSSASEVQTVIEGLTLCNGHSASGGGCAYGTAVNCIIEDCYSTGNGGGAYQTILKDCDLIGNIAQSDGGGAYGDRVVASRCLFMDNTSFSYGGGAYCGAYYDSVFDGNSASSRGGAAYGATLQRCTLTGNRAPYGGGTYNGTMYSCLYYDNYASSSAGGAYYGTLYNCTLTRNKSASAPAGSYYPTAYNTIIWDNLLNSGSVSDCNGSSYYNCCQTGGSGTGLIAEDPKFFDPANDDFRLSRESPCRDVGNNSNVKESTDILGATRIQDETVDMGCYENAVMVWDISVVVCGEGRVIDHGKSILDKGSLMFEAVEMGSPFLGFYTNGVFATSDKEFTWKNISSDGILEVWFKQDVYVDSAKIDDSGDGLTWETARKDLAAVVAEASNGANIWVKSGTYLPIVTANKKITITAVDGNSTTVIDGGGTNCCVYAYTNNVSISVMTNTVVVGFTIRNGYALQGGAAYGGTLCECVIVSNTATRYGGGTYYGVQYGCTYRDNSVDGTWRAQGGAACFGTSYNCIYENNMVNGVSSSEGGAIFGGVRYDCLIKNNVSNARGGGVAQATCYRCVLTGNSAKAGGGSYSGSLRDCLIAENEAVGNGGGSYGSTLIGCTVVKNIAGDAGGVVAGVARNSIIWGNSVTNGVSTNCVSTTLQYSCTDSISGEIGCIIEDPKFVDVENGDYRLLHGSPCIDAGNNSYLSTRSTHDIAKKNRVVNRVVDMGCYEGAFLPNAETQSTPKPIPHAWLDSLGILSSFGGDYEAMANAPSPGANGSGKIWPNGSPCYMWQDFVAGTSPTNDAVFTAIIRMDGNTPVITWEPDTPELRATRVYRTYGKKTLMDANWTDITDKDMSEYHFFKVTVDLP